MSKYDIHTLWFWRKGEDGPELLEAWDDYTRDQNWSGWEEACKRAFDEVREDDAGNGPRHIKITIDYGPIEQAFYPVEIDGVSRSVQTDGSAEEPAQHCAGDTERKV